MPEIPTASDTIASVSRASRRRNRDMPMNGSTSNADELDNSEKRTNDRPISENTKRLREMDSYAADTPNEMAARHRENENTEAIRPNKIGECDEKETLLPDLMEMNELSCFCAAVVERPGTNEDI